MWLGHHSPAFTLATYVHLVADDLPDPSFLDALTTLGGNKVATGAPEIGRDGALETAGENVPFPGQTRSAEMAGARF